MSEINLEERSPRLEVLPEGCHQTKDIRNAKFRIAHITRDLSGSYTERLGWLITDVVCRDAKRVCIQYDSSRVFIDVPANEVVIVNCKEYDSSIAVGTLNDIEEI